jgi:hypothetical protein
LHEDSSFCGNCGNQIAEHVKCEECGKELHPETEMCPSCGNIIQESGEKLSEQTLIEKEESRESTEENQAATKIEFDESVEKTETIPGKRKHNILVAKGRIEVSRITMLLIGIIILIQNILLIGVVTGAISTSQGISSYLFNGEAVKTGKYHGFTEKDYKNNGKTFSSDADKSFGFENKKKHSQNDINNAPKIPKNIFNLVLLVVIIGIIQGIGFILLSKFVLKNAFLAILIAFIFELTYDILKIVSSIYRAISGVNINMSQFNNILSKGNVNILLALQVILLVVISAVLIFYLGRGLQSAIQLRKMGTK